MSIILASGKLKAQSSGNNIVLYSITEANGLSDDHVQCVLKDKKGLVWVGTSDGLNLMDGSSIIIFRHSNNDSTSLVNNDVSSLAEDSLGNIWIGTHEGLCRYSSQKNNFISFTPPASPYGKSAFFITLYADVKQRIWCCTDGGLLLFDPANRSFQPFYNSNAKRNGTLYCNKLTHFIKDKIQNKLWISSSDGLWAFDLNTHLYKQAISPQNDPNYEELFTYVYQSNDNKLWTGSWGNGLEQLDEHTGKVTHYTSLPMHPIIISNIAETQQPDGKNILWLNGKLLAFDPSASRFFHYSILSQTKESPDLFPCYQSADGWIWLASSSGLYIYNPSRQLFQNHFFANEITNQSMTFGEWNHSLLIGGEADNFLNLYDEKWNLKKSFSSLFNLVTTEKKSGTVPSVLSIAQNKTELWIGSTSGIAKMNIETSHTQWFFHNKNDSTSLPRNFITHLFLILKNDFGYFRGEKGFGHWILQQENSKNCGIIFSLMQANQKS